MLKEELKLIKVYICDYLGFTFVIDGYIWSKTAQIRSNKTELLIFRTHLSTIHTKFYTQCSTKLLSYVALLCLLDDVSLMLIIWVFNKKNLSI